MSENPSSTATAAKEPWLAVVLSKLLPGIGQMYAGYWLKGLIFAISYLCLNVFGAWAVFSDAGDTRVGMICLLLGMIVLIVALLDAHRGAKRQNSEAFETARRSDKDPWLATFLSLWIPGLGHLYLGKWLIGIGLFVLFVVVADPSPDALSLIHI